MTSNLNLLNSSHYIEDIEEEREKCNIIWANDAAFIAWLERKYQL